MIKSGVTFFIGFFCCCVIIAQPPKGIHWDKDGKSFYSNENGEIVRYGLPSFTKTVIADEKKLTPAGASGSLKVRNFFFSNDDKKILIYTNSKKVWRYDTRGDYWILNLDNNKLSQVGKSLPPSSLMFAKFSPDAT